MNNTTEELQLQSLVSENNALKSVSEKSLSLIIYAVSIVICLAVAFLIYFPQALSIGGGVNVSYLPRFHAFLNGSCAILLLTGYIAIRQRKFNLHRTLMVTCFVLSSVFLVSYVIYHSQAPATKYGGEGIIRPIYFSILVTHIVLAALILPLALFTISRSWRGEFAKHKRIARITLPIWLYVTITGVVVYFMLAPYYRFL
jgi:putative membrane protein